MPMDDLFLSIFQSRFGYSIREPLTQQEAKEILQFICRWNGYLDPDDNSQLRDSTNQQDKDIWVGITRTRNLLAGRTKDIMGQLYDDPFRFFFEILQNADDAKNQFAGHGTTLTSTSLPCVTFTIQRDRLLIDLIENEFTLENVVAICSTGESSKRTSQTIGHKGFGFKSVFAIASSVHIQSGEFWSFALKHKKGEDGIGMVLPLWQPPCELPEHVSTRITLNFCEESSNVNLVPELCNWIESQPVSIVGFLKRIRKVKILFDGIAGSRYQKMLLEKRTSIDEGLQELVATIDDNENTHTYRELAWSGPINAVDENASNMAEITIRFPVSDSDKCEPLVDADGQYTFAYLPMRQVPQLPFIIHANFSLTGSRQDVEKNPWNQALKQKIAIIFVDAVASSVAHGTFALRFKWLSYLPARNQPIPGFWEDLLSLIKTELSDKKVFFSARNSLVKAKQLRSLPDMFLHQGNPILRNLVDSDFSYLSRNYLRSDANILKDLGVEELSVREILETVRHDCSSNSPQFCKRPLADPWHNAYAKLLITLMQDDETEKHHNVTASLRNLPIFPIRVGELAEWQSSQRSIYFPVLVDEKSGSKKESVDLKITMPTDLELTVLHSDAVASPIRQKLYRMLGVQDCAWKVLQKAIVRAQKRNKEFTIQDCVSHFELLFWHSYSNSLNHELYAISIDSDVMPSNRLLFYSTEPLGIGTLVQSTEDCNYNEYFLHDDYATSPVQHWVRNGKTWKQWLRDVAGIRSYPSLNDPDRPDLLHPLVQAVRIGKPVEFLPMIQRHWAESYSAACSSPEIRTALLESSVLCRHENVAHLQNAWFPSAEIVAEAESFNVETELPILSLPDSTFGCDLTMWSALRDLGISAVADFAFYKEALLIMSSRSEVSTEKVRELYIKLGLYTPYEKQADLKELFDNNAVVWDPISKEWLSKRDCVWMSEVSLHYKFVLTSAYPEQAKLFKNLLELEDANATCLISELEQMKKKEPDIDRASKIYVVLKNMSESKDEKTRQLIRLRFEKRRLIFHKSHWLRLDQCIWHATVTIQNYTTIHFECSELRDFFVNVLEIKTVTVSFMMQELVKAAIAPNETIRDLMLETSKTIPNNFQRSEFESSIVALKNARFLPCRSPQQELIFLSLHDSFFIVDDEKYARHFKGKLHITDFTYRDLTTLHKLFDLLGLRDRYLSKHVKVETVEGETRPNEVLTQQLQECAYALSCCAVFHHSPLYCHEAQEMHEVLLATRVYTSSNMSTKYVVKQDKDRVEVLADKVLLTTKVDQNHLRIVLPEDEAECRLSLGGQLPKLLAKLLHISNASAEKQIYRIINETELGIEEILANEDIPYKNLWFPRTQQLPMLQGRNTVGNDSASDGQQDAIPFFPDSEVHRSDVSPNRAMEALLRRQPSPTRIPKRVNHLIEAPKYGDLLEYLRRRAAAVIWRNTQQESTLVLSDNHAVVLRELTEASGGDTDPREYPQLFGSDGSVMHRLGAAGEFFMLELLRGLTRGRAGEEQWRSSIRHFARAHKDYHKISIRSKQEIADIVYDDKLTDGEINVEGPPAFERDMLKVLFQRQVIGDSFEGWLPQWMSEDCTCSEITDDSSIDSASEEDHDNTSTIFEDNTGDSTLSDSTSDSSHTPSLSSSAVDAPKSLCSGCNEANGEPIEWLFEVKTTLGPCGTPFFISPYQYGLMQSTGNKNGRGRRQVYCIVRIYNLLQKEVGIRIFIDPWRFRNDRLRLSSTSWHAVDL